MRAGKAAVLLEGAWQTLEQATARNAGFALGFNRRFVTEFKPPGLEAEEYIGKGVTFTREGDAVTAELSPQTVNELLAAGGLPVFGRRRGGGPIEDAKGSVVFRITNGVLAGFTVKLNGSRAAGFGRTLKLDRTITTSITGLGTTRVDVPEDAKEIVDALIAGRRPDVFVPEPGFHALFDGRTLAGWEGRPGFWSVEDKAIIGRTTKENPLTGNTFLFAKAGGKDLIVDDFELRLSYRITADNDKGFANSGIQYRSQNRGNFVAAGYQADIEAGSQHSGILYDEAGGAGGRGIMASRGQMVTWTLERQEGDHGAAREARRRSRRRSRRTTGTNMSSSHAATIFSTSSTASRPWMFSTTSRPNGWTRAFSRSSFTPASR